MEFLTRMDVFLGSDSNMYPLVAGRRIALDVNGRNGFPRHSCALLSTSVHEEYQPPTKYTVKVSSDRGSDSIVVVVLVVTVVIGPPLGSSGSSSSNIIGSSCCSCIVVSVLVFIYYITVITYLCCVGSSHIRSLWNYLSRGGYGGTNPSLFDAPLSP